MSDTKSPPRRSGVPEWLKVWLPLMLLFVGVMILVWRVIEPAPPRQAVIATGRSDGDYYATAQLYSRIFGENGINLEVRATKGTGENYDLLADEKSGIDLAIVQGGMFPADKLKGKVEAVASIYYEPAWVFHRLDPAVDRISQLAGKRIAIGSDGSGTKALSLQLLGAYGLGVDGDKSGTELQSLGGTDAAAALIEGKVDAMVLVASAKSSTVKKLLENPKISLMSLHHAAGLSRVFTHLSEVTLYEGSIDPQLNLPSRTVSLIAPTATLVARESTHKGLVLLAAQSAVKVHSGRGLLNDAGAFPSVKDLEMPVSPESKYFIDRGPSFLMRKFPFWLASWIERMIILLVPMLTLLIPLIRIAPPLYAWRVRSKILRWYKEVRRIDEGVPSCNSAARAEDLHKQIAQVREQAHEVHVPTGYMRELYELCSHIDLVRHRLEEQMKKSGGKEA